MICRQKNNEKHQNNEIYMVRMLLLVVVCIGLLPIQMRAQKNSYIIPGEVWKDTDGNPINAHGGGLLYHDGTYYWYGEYKRAKRFCLIGLHGSVIVQM